MLRTTQDETKKKKISEQIDRVNEDITWEFLFNLEGSKAFLTLTDFP